MVRQIVRTLCSLKHQPYNKHHLEVPLISTASQTHSKVSRQRSHWRMLAATQRVKLTVRKSRSWQSARHYQYFGDGTMRHQRQDSAWDKMIKIIQPPVQPGTLIVVRHGESEWNAKRLFTGWVDTDLTDRGIREIEHASRLLLERGYTVDITYTSLLKRAVRSSWIMLNEINQIYTPVVKTWRLNERMYVSLHFQFSV